MVGRLSNLGRGPWCTFTVLFLLFFITFESTVACQFNIDAILQRQIDGKLAETGWLWRRRLRKNLNRAVEKMQVEIKARCAEGCTEIEVEGAVSEALEKTMIELSENTGPGLKAYLLFFAAVTVQATVTTTVALVFDRSISTPLAILTTAILSPFTSGYAAPIYERLYNHSARNAHGGSRERSPLEPDLEDAYRRNRQVLSPNATMMRGALDTAIGDATRAFENARDLFNDGNKMEWAAKPIANVLWKLERTKSELDPMLPDFREAAQDYFGAYVLTVDNWTVLRDLVVAELVKKKYSDIEKAKLILKFWLQPFDETPLVSEK